LEKHQGQGGGRVVHETYPTVESSATNRLAGNWRESLDARSQDIFEHGSPGVCSGMDDEVALWFRDA
jgi:hypothetical protein